MKRTLLLFFLLAGPVFAQSTTVSGTITDAGSQAWANGTYQIQFNANGVAPPFTWNGGALTTTFFSGSLNSSGAFSGVSIPSSNYIGGVTQGSTLWTFTICPAASAPCFSTNISVTGATQSVSSAIIPPAISVSFSGVPVKAYADSEVSAGAVVGSSYYNLTDSTLHVCTVSLPCTWVSVSGGGGGSGFPITLGSTSIASSSTTTTLAGLTLTDPTLNGAAIGGAFTGTGNYIPVTLLNSGTSASSSTFWRGDGTWATPSGSGNTTSTSLTTGFSPKANGANSIINSALDDGATTANTLSYSGSGGITATGGPITSSGAGSHGLSLGCGTAIGATASFIGFTVPSSCSSNYGNYNWPVLPTSAGVAHVAAASSNVSAVTVSAVVSADLNITPTTCTNQFIDAISAGAVGTCASIPNAALSNSAITIAGTSVSLGGSTSSLPSPGAIGGTTPAAITGTTITGNTSVTTPEYLTSTNCSAAGTAASPSVVSCSAASSGQFSCATNASTATCTVDTSAIATTSEVFVQPDASASISGVTCNTTADTGLTAPRLASRSSGTSFTINLGTFSSNPLCFDYFVVNP